MEMQMEFIRKLPSPQELMQDYPLGAEASAVKTARDKEIREIISGSDDRFILVIGPCSADNEDAVLDYVHRLAGVQEKVKEKLMLVPRVYTNKPRTIGVGYKGMLHQANPEGKEDMLAGITAISPPSARCTCVWYGKPVLPARKKSCIRKTTATFPTFYLMQPSAHVPWKTSCTG